MEADGNIRGREEDRRKAEEGMAQQCGNTSNGEGIVGG